MAISLLIKFSLHSSVVRFSKLILILSVSLQKRAHFALLFPFWRLVLHNGLVENVKLSYNRKMIATKTVLVHVPVEISADVARG